MASRTLERWLPWMALFCGGLVFLLSTLRIAGYARSFEDDELSVALPRFVQVIMTGGDRHLAANIAVVRSLLNPLGNDSYEHYAAQARVQLDAAWLNPRHEDNYYVAAALLAWSGHEPEANLILEQAVAGRPFDMLPPLYLGFNHFFFERNPALGSQWMYRAAERADSEQNRISLTRIASRWAERGQDTRDALRMVEVMIRQARGLALKRYLQARAERLGVIIELQDAARNYAQKFGRPLAKLDDLVSSGMLKRLPPDPQGLGYSLDGQGVPVLNQPQIRGSGPAPRPFRQ